MWDGFTKFRTFKDHLGLPDFSTRISCEVRDETTDLRSDGGGIRFDFTMDIEDRYPGPVRREVYGTSAGEW